MSPDDDISSTLTATPISSTTSSSSPSATPPATPIQHKLDNITTNTINNNNNNNSNNKLNDNNGNLVQPQQQIKLIQNFDNLAAKLNGKKWQIMPEKKETFLEEKNDLKNLYKLINSTDVVATVTPPSSPTSRSRRTPTITTAPSSPIKPSEASTTNNILINNYNNNNNNNNNNSYNNNIINNNNNHHHNNSKLLNDHTTPLLLLDNDDNKEINKKLDKNFNNKINKIIMNNNTKHQQQQQNLEQQQELQNQSMKKSATPILLKKDSTNNGWKELSQDDDINNFNAKNNTIGNNNGSIINGKNGIGNGNGHTEQLAEEDPLTGNLNLKQLDDDELSNCGIGTCQPKWARPFASTHFFMVVFLLAWILQGMYCTYFVSVITTIEKLFQIQSKTTGLLMSATEIGQIGTALFLTYFAGRGHRPRWIACGIFLFAISSFCCALPHFIYGDQILHASNIFNGHALQNTQTTTRIYNNKTSMTKTDNLNLCYASDNNTSHFNLDKDCEEDILVEQVAHSQITVFVFIIFFFGLLGVGIGSTAVSTLGIPYIDDNVASRESPIYIAITIGVRILGPAAGFILGSFCTRIYVDISIDPGFSPSNPKWVGAWWLGLVLISTLMAITSLAMFAFPKNLKGNRIPPPMKMRAIEAQKKIEKQEEEYKTPQLKDFPKTIKRQLSNDILMFRTASSVLHLLPVAGLYTFLPKYLESQFRLPAHDANLISGVCGILVMGIGIVISGVVILKFNPTARSVAGWIAFTAIVYACGMAILMFVGCPMDDFAGFKPNNQNSLPKFELTCNLTCNCDFNKYSPICGADGMIYFSPCHAGCSQLTTEKKETQFFNCDCIPSVNMTLPTLSATGPKIAEAVGGYCEGNCKNFLLFITLFCFFVFMHSTSEVGSMLLIMRCTDPKDKAMAMGIIQFAIGLFGNVPCPIIYGAVVDSACLVWETICGKQGACSLYDVNVFRHFFLGTTAGIMLLAFVMDLVVWHKAHRIDIDPESTSDTEIDKPTNVPESTV